MSAQSKNAGGDALANVPDSSPSEQAKSAITCAIRSPMPRMTVAPITPDQVIEKRRAGIPPQVFEAFNELLERKYQGGSCTIEQDEAVDLILKKRIDMNRAQISESGWLDIEPSYRDAGWDVTHDKPGYGEIYPARFVFSRKSAK